MLGDEEACFVPFAVTRYRRRMSKLVSRHVRTNRQTATVIVVGHSKETSVRPADVGGVDQGTAVRACSPLRARAVALSHPCRARLPTPVADDLQYCEDVPPRTLHRSVPRASLGLQFPIAMLFDFVCV